MLFFFLLQASIYRTAVKYVISFFSPPPHPSDWRVSSPAKKSSILMGILNKKNKKYEYFCTMCNKEIFMHHKEFVCLCAINYYYYY